MMEDKLNELIDRLRKAHGTKLVSVVLYGSAASGDGADAFSDLNVMTVLTQVGAPELAEAEPVVRWWRKHGNPSPLLMSEREVRASADCFPIEFHDMQERRRVLFGKDVIDGLVVQRAFYRAQVEYQLRAELLRFRQHAARVAKDQEALLRLMLESMSTFCVLSRHVLLLDGREVPPGKRAITAALRGAGLNSAAMEQLTALREHQSKASGVDVGVLFSEYLKEIEAVGEYVDSLEK